MSFNILDPLKMAAGGLLWNPIKRATGLTDAQMAGLGAMAVAAPFALPALMGSGAAATAGATAADAAGSAAAGSAGAGAGAGAGASAGSPGLLSQFNTIAGPVSQGLGIANQVSSMNRSAPIQGAQLPQSPAPDFSGLLNYQTQEQQAMAQDQMQRRQMQNQYIQALMNGGNYGRIA